MAQPYAPAMRGAVLLALACASILLNPGVLDVQPRGVGIAASVGSSHLLIAANPEVAEPNGTVVADIYTYQGTDLADANGTPCVTWRRIPPPWWNCVSVARVGVGHYRANLSMPPYTPDGVAAGVVTFQWLAVANMSDRRAYAMTPVYRVFEGAWLRAYANRSMVMPGDPLHVTIEVLNGSKRVDAGSVSVNITSSNASFDRDFAVNRTDIGVYETDLRVPEYDPLEDWISIEARALYRVLPLERPVVFAQAGEYQSWYHETSSDLTASHGDLWVADRFGRPAPGIPVNITLSNGAFSTLNLATDAAGRVPLTLPYGLQHGISLSLRVGPDNPNNGWHSVTLFPQGNPFLHTLAADPSLLPGGQARDCLRPNETAERHFRAVEYNAENVAVPQPNQDVDYLAWTDEGLALSGRTRSDAQGLFSISLPVPRQDLALEISWGNQVPDTFLYRVASPRVGMTVSPLTLGRATTVNVSAAGLLQRIGELDGAWAEVEVLGTTNESWTVWTPICSWNACELAPGRQGITGDLYLPSFLPQDAKYAIHVGMVSDVGQVAVLGVGERLDLPAAGTTPASDLAPWLILGVLATAGILVVAAVLLLRRRRRVEPPHP